MTSRMILGLLIFAAIIIGLLAIAGCVDRPLTQSEKDLVRMTWNSSQITGWAR